jgi:hypothetical protein
MARTFFEKKPPAGKRSANCGLFIKSGARPALAVFSLPLLLFVFFLYRFCFSLLLFAFAFRFCFLLLLFAFAFRFTAFAFRFTAFAFRFTAFAFFTLFFIIILLVARAGRAPLPFYSSNLY